MTTVGTDRRQQRLALAILFGTIAVTALLFAQGTTMLLAESIFDIEPHPGASAATTSPGTAVAAAEPARTRDKMRILRRNMFDSLTGPLDGTRVADVAPSTAPPPAPVPVDPNAPPPSCDGSMRLVAAVVSPRSPDLSLAAITNAAGKVLLYRPGMSVDGREVVDVRSDEVRLRPSGGALCALLMFSNGPRTATAPPAVAVATNAAADAVAEAPAAGDGAIAAAELDRGIQRVSDTEFGVSRSLLDRVLENRAALMRTARVVPHEVDGRVVGVKLYGIRRNSLLGRVGIENGDILRSINGFDMSDPTAALDAYSRLRGADHLTVAVERRGTPMSLNYNIR